MSGLAKKHAQMKEQVEILLTTLDVKTLTPEHKRKIADIQQQQFAYLAENMHTVAPLL